MSDLRWAFGKWLGLMWMCFVISLIFIVPLYFVEGFKMALKMELYSCLAVNCIFIGTWGSVWISDRFD